MPHDLDDQLRGLMALRPAISEALYAQSLQKLREQHGTA